MRALPLLILCLCLTSCNEPDQQLTQTAQNEPTIPTSPQEKPIVINPTAESTITPPIPESPPTIELKAGENIDVKVFGLKPYPNLIKSDTNNQSSLAKTNEETKVTLTQFTKDPPSRVADFYAKQIISNKSKSVTSATAVVGGLTSTGAKIFVVATRINEKTQLSITATITK
ncbi:MAG: hypothetical protein ACKVQS_04450 [Fimbriimonadaceae bacterium]